MPWYSEIKDLFKDARIEKVNAHLIVINGKIHLHRDIWERRQEQVISRLDSIFGKNTGSIFARNTRPVTLDKTTAQTFLNTNHLLGFGGGKTFIGLKDDTELVAVAVFSKILFKKYEDPPYYSVELVRYCSLQGSTVAGGLDKLIKAYLEEHNVDDIVTSIDKEWSNGSSYKKLGFEIIGETEPLQFTVNPSNWEREVYKKQISEGCYLVENLGNLKMRLNVS